MAIITDTLETVFKTTGISTAISAIRAAENATDRMASAQLRLQNAQKKGNADVIEIAQRRFNIAGRNQFEAVFQEAAASAQPFIKTLQTITDFAKDAMETTAKFGTEVMNLRAITGGSGAEAAGALNLFKGAGLGSAGARELANLNKVVFSGEGQGALQQLGISAQQGESSIHLFDRIASSLNRMQDGWYKMRIEQQLGVENMQELLRMSDATRQKIEAFSDSMGGDALQTIQKFNETTGLLGVGLDSIKMKIGVDLMKVFSPVVNSVNWLVEKWEALDKAFNGVPTWVVSVGLLAGAMGSAVAAATALGAAFKALITIEKVKAVWDAVIDALEGNFGRIAAAAAIGAGAGIILSGINRIGEGGGAGESATDKFSNAVDNFGDSIRLWRDQWSAAPGIPRGMTANDTAHLLRMQVLGAIG